MIEKYKVAFTEARFIELCQIIKVKGMKICYKDFTKSELLLIIEETPLSPKQKQGAIEHYIEKKKIKDLAIEFDYSESEIQYYKRKVSKELKKTCNRIFK